MDTVSTHYVLNGVTILEDINFRPSVEISLSGSKTISKAATNLFFALFGIPFFIISIHLIPSIL